MQTNLKLWFSITFSEKAFFFQLSSIPPNEGFFFFFFLVGSNIWKNECNRFVCNVGVQTNSNLDIFSTFFAFPGDIFSTSFVDKSSSEIWFSFSLTFMLLLTSNFECQIKIVQKSHKISFTWQELAQLPVNS